MFAMATVVVLYSKRRPANAPLTWGEAMAAAVFVTFGLFWSFGVVPHQWLTYAQGSLNMRSDAILAGPGSTGLAKWSPIVISKQTIADSVTIGLYGLAFTMTLVLWSVAAIGQNYSFTFHEPLRVAGGAVEAGPPLKITSALAVAGGIGVAGTGVVLWLAGTEDDLWVCFLVLALATTTRFYGAVFTTVLALQSRDVLRARMSLVAVAVKAAGIFALAEWLGSTGAAIAFVVADLVAFAWAFRALYGPRPEVVA